MNPILRNIIAVVLGLFIGGTLNALLITLGPSIVPYPEGFNPNDMEHLKDNIHLLKPANFVMTFLAHALGTLLGAFITAKIAASRNLMLALFVGGFFLIGGIMMAASLAAPIAFEVIDLLLAYIPMAFIGWKLAGSKI